MNDEERHYAVEAGWLDPAQERIRELEAEVARLRDDLRKTEEARNFACAVTDAHDMSHKIKQERLEAEIAQLNVLLRSARERCREKELEVEVALVHKWLDASQEKGARLGREVARLRTVLRKVWDGTLTSSDQAKELARTALAKGEDP